MYGLFGSIEDIDRKIINKKNNSLKCWSSEQNKLLQ